MATIFPKVSEEPFLSVSDLRDVFRELFHMRSKWRRLGLELDLAPGTLDAIERERPQLDDRLERVLHEWLNSGSATWRQLVEVLESYIVNENNLAGKLRERYSTEKRKPGNEASLEPLKSSSGRLSEVKPQVTLVDGNTTESVDIKTTPLDGKSGLTYEETQLVMEDNPTTRYLSVDLQTNVIAQKCVEITNKKQDFTWKGYGLQLLIPENSLPAGVDKCVLHISVYLSSPYEIPSDHKLVSAVYNINCKPKVEFREELTLKIQHCANSASLPLSFAQVTANQLNVLENGFFSDGRYGSIQVKKFCWYMILSRIQKFFGLDSEPEPCDYCALQFYKVVCSNFKVQIRIVICRNLEAHASKVKENLRQFHCEGDTVVSIDTSIELDIEDDPILPDHDPQRLWKVLPISEPMILTKKRIDRWSDSPNTASIPSFLLKAIFDSSSTKNICELSRKLTLKCKERRLNTFNLLISRQEFSEAAQHPPTSDDIDKEVSDEHILEIYQQLEKWRLVAAHLGLTQADVQAIETQARVDEELMRLYMLQKWKSKKKLDGTATYGVLLKALEKCNCAESVTQVHELLL